MELQYYKYVTNAEQDCCHTCVEWIHIRWLMWHCHAMTTQCVTSCLPTSWPLHQQCCLCLVLLDSANTMLPFTTSTHGTGCFWRPRYWVLHQHCSVETSGTFKAVI